MGTGVGPALAQGCGVGGGVALGGSGVAGSSDPLAGVDWVAQYIGDASLTGGPTVFADALGQQSPYTVKAGTPSLATINGLTALDLDGSDDTVTGPVLLSGRATWSITVVVEPDNVAPSGGHTIVGENVSSTAGHFWNFQLDTSGYYFLFRGTSTGGVVYCGLGAAVNGVPRVFTATWDGTDLLLYMDGGLVNTKLSQRFDTVVCDRATMGCSWFSSTTYLNDFDGRVGQYEVCNDVLTLDQVAARHAQLSRWYT